MLRWLVVGLLLSNAIYFWWRHDPAPSSSGEAMLPVSTSGERLVLLHETRNTVPVSTSNVPQASKVGVCHMIGPFREKVSANQVKDRLRAFNIAVNTYRFTLPDKPDFWVYLGPLRSRKEALEVLRELQNKKVDSFLIGDGELANGISLGFFTREPLAQAALKQRREQGYDAKLKTVPRFSQELWEVFADEYHAKLTEENWRQIKAGTQGVEVRKSACNLIASAEKLD